MSGGGVWSGDRRLLTTGIVGLVTAVAFEGLAVSTILPRTASELDGLALYGWAFSAFWLTNILGITVAGGDADRHGPGRAFAAGVALFALGLTLAALAVSMPMLIVARAVQGFGSGAIGAVVYVVVARAYPAAAHPRMLAIMSSAWVVPGLVGPALAALITSLVGWRWVFAALLVPVLGLALLARAPITVLRAAEHADGDGEGRIRSALGLSIGCLLVLVGLTMRSAVVETVVLLGGIGLTVLGLRALLPAGAMRLARGAAAVPLIVFATSFAFFGAEAYIPLAITDVRGGTLAAGALALSAATITWTGGSWLQARLVPRGWRRGLVGIGNVLIAAGIAGTTLVLVPALGVEVAALAWAVAGLGMGLAYTTLSLLTLESAEPGREGAASAALQLTFTLGTAFGTGVGGAWVSLAADGTLSLATAIAIAFAITAVVVVLAAVASVRLPGGGTAASRSDREAMGAVGLPPRS